MAEETTNIHILATKLNRPPVDARWVLRPRLITTLDSALKKRVTLLSAPAGYGKTTLVAQWLDHIATPSAWLSLDQNDGYPDRFLKYLTAAVRRVVPIFGPALDALYLATVLPPPEYLADALIGALAALSHPLVVVLDDFHHFVSEPVMQMLARVVQYQPENLHLVISTRMDPPLPVAKWRVRGWLEEIRAADLRFFEDEAQTFFQSFFDEVLSRDTVKLIFKRTEGWVAGMQLARLSLTTAENRERFAHGFSGNSRMVTDFLVDEVIALQTPEIREFLFVTALFERFCAPLCEAMLRDRPNGRASSEIIRKLEQENLFLVPLDSERVWYRYHNLFKTLLTHHIKAELSEERKTQIFRRAGKWFAGQGLIEEALQYYLAAGEVIEATALIESVLDEELGRDLSRRTLRRWLDMFPAPALKQQPALAVALVYCKIFHWDFNEMDQLMDAAEASLNDPACIIPESRRQKLLTDVDTQRGFYLYWTKGPHDALKHLLRALKNLSDAYPYTHHAAVMYAALAYSMTGALDKGLQLVSEAISTAYSTGSPYTAAFLFVPAGIHYYAGDLAGAEQMSEKIIALHDDRTVYPYWRLHAHWMLGCVAYERNRLDVAAAHFQSVERMPYQVNTRPYHDSLIGLALVAMARYDTAKAREYADAARDFAIEVKDPYSMAISDSFEIRLNMASHRMPTGAFLNTPPVDGNQIFLETQSLTYAEHLICKDKPADCQAGLVYTQNAVAQLQQQNNTRQLIQFMAVKAVALKRAGRLNKALEVLQETLDMAEPLGFVRSFVDRGPLMAELLSDLSAKRPQNRYLKSLLGAFGDKPPVETTAVFSVDHRSTAEQAADAFLSSELSNRELDVLELLRKRLTDKEIAQRLFISHQTVKKHTASIYRKMNVAGRRQAVSAAQQMDILKAK